MRKQLLSLLVTFAILQGCQTTTTTPSQPPAPVEPVQMGGFVQTWRAPLMTASPIARLYLRNDMLFAYTEGNSVYAMSATGGQVLWSHQMGHAGDQVMPPLVMDKGVTIIPGISTLDRIDAKGNPLPEIEIGHSVSSPLSAASSSNYVYCGLHYPTGGRLAKIDLTKKLNFSVWEFMVTGGVSAAPVLFQGIVFGAGEDGNVYAVNEQGQVIWPLPDGHFKTDGRIVADLKADGQGVYVASTDTKLYCLDVTTGKIKWVYFASVPLLDSPEVTADSVYQSLPNAGVVALDKAGNDNQRKPRWTAPSAKRFVAEDAQYTYLQTVDNAIIGVDKKTGEQKFHSGRTDLVAFASNPKGNMIYAATANGDVLGITAANKPGMVGQVVKVDLDFQPLALVK